MADSLGPPFRVSLDPNGAAVVTLPLDWAKTLKEKLAPYGFPSTLTEGANAAKGGEVATLDFGSGVDLVRLQKTIDSFTIPPISVIAGS